MWDSEHEREKRGHRDGGRSVNTRMSEWSRHLHSAPGFLLPTGIFGPFKVLNWRTHHNRHTDSHIHRESKRDGRKQRASRNKEVRKKTDSWRRPMEEKKLSWHPATFLERMHIH